MNVPQVVLTDLDLNLFVVRRTHISKEKFLKSVLKENPLKTQNQR